MAVQKKAAPAKAVKAPAKVAKAPAKVKKEVPAKTVSSMMEKQKIYAEKLMKSGKMTRGEVAQALVDKFGIAKSSATSYVYRWFIGDAYKAKPKKVKAEKKAVVKPAVKPAKKTEAKVTAKAKPASVHKGTLKGMVPKARKSKAKSETPELEF